MKAAWFDRFGPPGEVLQVGEMHEPNIGHGEVRVRVETSGVNPSDVKKRAGSFPNLLDDGPVIPHSDGAGIIEAVGPGVPAARIGERVWLYQAQFARRFGTAAQYVSLPAERAVRLPEGVGLDVGACLGIPAMTAHRCVFADGPVEDQTLLITGGAGRVGYYAIQFAKYGGATVVATASDEKSVRDCQRAGADYVVSHRAEGFVEAVRDVAPTGKVDRVIDVDFGANLPRTLDLIRVSGVIATYASGTEPEPRLPFFRMMYMDLTVRAVIVYAMPESAKQDAIEDISDLLERNLLLHRISHQVSLDDIARGHELIEQGGFRGCVIVNIK